MELFSEAGRISIWLVVVYPSNSYSKLPLLVLEKGKDRLFRKKESLISGLRETNVPL